jgi:hypothetical protein
VDIRCPREKCRAFFQEVVLANRAHGRNLGIDLAAREGDSKLFIFITRNDP